MKNKFIVIGLDGATWKLLDKWKDHLPTIHGLINNGVRATLESSLPPVTFPAWKCYSTGKNPAKLGAFHWIDIDYNRGIFKFNNSTSFKSPEIWDYLGTNGIKSAVINMPTTYPPREINGYMISGPFSSGRHFYTPSSLGEIIEQLHYSPFQTSVLDNPKRIMDSAFPIIESRFALAEYLLKEVDFLHLTIFCIDKMQHILWDAQEVLEAWKFIDKKIQGLISKIPKATVILFSDHGFDKIEKIFYINNFFKCEGYLTLKSNRNMIIGKAIRKMGMDRKYFYNLAKKMRVLKLAKLLSRDFLTKLKESIPTANDEIGFLSLDKQLDWDKTQALFSSLCIHLNPRVKNDKGFRGEVKKRLCDVCDENGHNPIKRIFEKEEIYRGPFLDKAPELVIEFKKGYRGRGHLRFDKEYFSVPKDWIADHDSEGIFVMSGQGIQRGGSLGKISIADIAPTILKLYNIAIPEDLDGRVLQEVLE